MPSGFALPIHTVTRLCDGMAVYSSKPGGITAMAQYFGESTEHFKWQLKLGWSRHVDTGAKSFQFATTRFVSGNRGHYTETHYTVTPLLRQSAPVGSKFVPLTARHLDNLVMYLREARTDRTATTFSLTYLASVPKRACYTPQNIAIDLSSDMFQISFASRSSRLRQTQLQLVERYYFSVKTLGQMELKLGKRIPNLRPKLKVFWSSELEQHSVMGRIQVCQLLLACRSADHIQAILRSPVLMQQRRGFTEIEHVTRELARTHCQDLTFLSRKLQQQNVGPPQLYLRDVDLAVAKAYRFSRQPIHMLSNTEYQNLEKIATLRCGKPALTYSQLGGPLYTRTVVENHNGEHKIIPLCEAKNTHQSRKTAKIAKDKMVVSLALLIVSIAERIERKHNVPGLTSNPKEQANLPFFMRNVCLGTNAGLDTVSHQSSSRRKRVKKTQHTRPHMVKPRLVRTKRIVPF
jgi:hypothetical protein